MDPKLSSLDPKLQDAYNRVMNTVPASPQVNPVVNPTSNSTPQITSTPPESTFTPNSQPQMDSAQQPIQPEYNSAQPTLNQPNITAASTHPSQTEAPVNNTTPVTNQATYPAPTPNTTPIPSVDSNQTSGSQSISATTPLNTNVNNKNAETTTVKEKNGHHLLPFFVGIVIVVSLLVYTLVWIVLFNLEIPFIPQL